MNQVQAAAEARREAEENRGFLPELRSEEPSYQEIELCSELRVWSDHRMYALKQMLYEQELGLPWEHPETCEETRAFALISV